MKTKYLISFIIISFAIIGSVILVDAANIQYPVKELGNCQDKTDCRAYCDKSENMNVCVDFAEKNNLMSEEEIRMAKKFIAAGGKGPGGCTTKVSCETYCNDTANIDECVSFAEKNNLMPPKELEEAKKIQAAIRRGVKPPSCENKKECDVYCEEPDHMEECIAFGMEAGFIQGKELEDAQKMLAAIKRGVKPLPCRGKEACDEYCSNPENTELCVNFATEAGFMNEQEKAESQKMLEAIRKGVKPPQCRGREECDMYCSQEEHFEECTQFVEAAGFMSAEEAAVARKTSGKGPGGCKGKEECEAFCNNPNNQETCFNFAKENGMISEEDLRRMDEGKQDRPRPTGEMAPPPPGEIQTGPGGGCGDDKCGPGESGVKEQEEQSGVIWCPQDCGYCGDSVCGAGEFSLNDFHSYCIDCQAGCGNGFCEPGESPEICLEDCGSTACGNGKCEWSESPTICPEDCGTACGNGTCDKGESPNNCVADCGPCGDNICQTPESIGGYCFKDCITSCGNGDCEVKENPANCPADCASICGDNICSLNESILSCPIDCQNSCGDGVCDGKDLKNHCEADCSIKCGDGICSPIETYKACPQDCKKKEVSYDAASFKKDPNGYCGDNICKGTETVTNCNTDCKAVCGNGTCDAGESSDNCKSDCGLLCGNKVCDKGENHIYCPIDCGYCGDKVCNLEKEKYCVVDCGSGLGCGNNECNPGENPENCPIDCKSSICGNGDCEVKENPANCPADCANICGDNICNKGETYLSCPWDCKYCGDGVCGIGEEKCSLDCTGF